eukprot:4935766-Lingulodinium_polyedra.AAC.1
MAGGRKPGSLTLARRLRAWWGRALRWGGPPQPACADSALSTPHRRGQRQREGWRRPRCGAGGALPKPA